MLGIIPFRLDQIFSLKTLFKNYTLLLLLLLSLPVLERVCHDSIKNMCLTCVILGCTTHTVEGKQILHKETQPAHSICVFEQVSLLSIYWNIILVVVCLYLWYLIVENWCIHHNIYHWWLLHALSDLMQ